MTARDSFSRLVGASRLFASVRHDACLPSLRHAGRAAGSPATPNGADTRQQSRHAICNRTRSACSGAAFTTAEKKAVGVRGPEKLGQSEPASTAAIVATETGVSAATIKRDGKLAAEVEAGRRRIDCVPSCRLVCSRRELRCPSPRCCAASVGSWPD